MSRCIVLALAAIVLFAPRAVAQETAKPGAPGLDPESIEKTIQGVDDELKSARDSLDKVRGKQQQLKQAYAGGDGAPERPSKYEALALMRRLEERASTQQRRQALDAVQRSLDRCTAEIDRVEESQAALGDSDEDVRRRWELQGYIRDLKTLQKRLTELALVREGEQETVEDTLFLLRRENLLLRGRSELSWSAIGSPGDTQLREVRVQHEE